MRRSEVANTLRSRTRVTHYRKNDESYIGVELLYIISYRVNDV